MGTEGGSRQGRISLLTEVVAYIGVILLLSGGVAAVGQPRGAPAAGLP